MSRGVNSCRVFHSDGRVRILGLSFGPFKSSMRLGSSVVQQIPVYASLEKYEVKQERERIMLYVGVCKSKTFALELSSIRVPV